MDLAYCFLYFTFTLPPRSKASLASFPVGSNQTIVTGAGEMVVVPRGFTGTWDMVGNYRELFVIEKQAYIKSQKPGGLLSSNERSSFKGELAKGVQLLNAVAAN